MGIPNHVCASVVTLAFSILLTACGSSVPTTQGQTNVSTSSGNTSSPSGFTASSNWSGYALSGSVAQFTTASGTWTVPAVSCPSGASTASATWVGIGGYAQSDPTLIQAGSEQDCDGGAGYYAWWEAYPEPSVELDTTTYPVHPGDQITVTLSSTAVLWTLTIHNLTANWTSTNTTPLVTAGESAEWIEEAPLSVGAGGSGEATLSNFGSVGFSGLTANGVNPELTTNDGIVMIGSNSKVIASPSLPGPSGNSFTDCYGAGACN